MYAHLRLRLQRDVVAALGNALDPRARGTATVANTPVFATVAVNYCRQTPLEPHRPHPMNLRVAVGNAIFRCEPHLRKVHLKTTDIHLLAPTALQAHAN